LPAARFSCNSHPTLVDPDAPNNVAEIDEGWDDVDRPAETSTTAPTKPATGIAVATPTPPIAESSSRDEKAAAKAAKAAKKSARRAARQAERRAREQANNRAAQKAAASREAKRTAQASSPKQSRPHSGEKNAKHASSPAALPDVAKTPGTLRTMIPLLVAAIAVLAALGWFLWVRAG
jgi:cobalamin biosynthesis Mg chelatase CobN